MPRRNLSSENAETLSRRQLLKVLGLGAAAATLPGCATLTRRRVRRPGEPGPPNIVFILIDDLGWKDVGFMGSTFYETPNIDRLASEGVVFTSAYANAPNCAPSRACLLTGQYPPRHGVYTVDQPDRGPAPRRRSGRATSSPFPSTDWARRGRWPTWRGSSPPRRRGTSRARRSTSTGAT